MLLEISAIAAIREAPPSKKSPLPINIFCSKPDPTPKPAPAKMVGDFLICWFLQIVDYVFLFCSQKPLKQWRSNPPRPQSMRARIVPKMTILALPTGAFFMTFARSTPVLNMGIPVMLLWMGVITSFHQQIWHFGQLLLYVFYLWDLDHTSFTPRAMGMQQPWSLHQRSKLDFVIKPWSLGEKAMSSLQPNQQLQHQLLCQHQHQLQLHLATQLVF